MRARTGRNLRPSRPRVATRDSTVLVYVPVNGVRRISRLDAVTEYCDRFHSGPRSARGMRGWRRASQESVAPGWKLDGKRIGGVAPPLVVTCSQLNLRPDFIASIAAPPRRRIDGIFRAPRCVPAPRNGRCRERMRATGSGAQTVIVGVENPAQFLLFGQFEA